MVLGYTDRSLISLAVLALFFILALGSVTETTEYMGKGIYKTTIQGAGGYKTVWTGPRNEHRLFHGPVTIEYSGHQYDVAKEEVTMVNGLRHGPSKATYTNGTVAYGCYKMDVWYECDNLSETEKSTQTPFGALQKRYPWFLLGLDGFGFDEEATREFADTLMALIQPNISDPSDFDESYDDALEFLGDETLFDQITMAHSDLTDMIGVEVIKAYEMRRAVLDQHRLSGNGTFVMLSTRYVDYLAWMQQTFVTEDIQAFCDSIDNKIVRYGPLDKEDPLFLDSIDIRFNRALNEMLFGKSGMRGTHASPNSADGNGLSRIQVRRFARELLQQSTASKAPADVALFVAAHMQQTMDQADPMRIILREFAFPDVKRLPTVVSQLDRIVSAVSVSVAGTVADNGGAAVTERGFVYGLTYNPTLEHSKVAVGSGLGDFSTVIAGLTTGQRYFVRSYATNEVGTAYGNQLEFVMETSTEVLLPDAPLLTFSVYPVPASGMVWISLDQEFASVARLSVISVSGQLIASQDVSFLGQQAVSIDVSGLKPGAYFVRIDLDGKTAVRKVVLR